MRTGIGRGGRQYHETTRRIVRLTSAAPRQAAPRRSTVMMTVMMMGETCPRHSSRRTLISRRAPSPRVSAATDRAAERLRCPTRAVHPALSALFPALSGPSRPRRPAPVPTMWTVEGMHGLRAACGSRTMQTSERATVVEREGIGRKAMKRFIQPVSHAQSLPPTVGSHAGRLQRLSRRPYRDGRSP